MITSRCSVCHEDISVSIRAQHKAQHNTEKQFEKGLEKGRVSKNKKTENEKTHRRKTGYQVFSVEMRPVLKESNKGISNREMLSLLGSEWRKLSKEEKEEWNGKAASCDVNAEKFPCPFCDTNEDTREKLKEHMY